MEWCNTSCTHVQGSYSYVECYLYKLMPDLSFKIISIDCGWCCSTLARSASSNFYGQTFAERKACSSKGFSWVGIQREEETGAGQCLSVCHVEILETNIGPFHPIVVFPSFLPFWLPYTFFVRSWIFGDNDMLQIKNMIHLTLLLTPPEMTRHSYLFQWPV